MMLRLKPRLAILRSLRSVDDGIFDAKVAALVDESDVKNVVSLNFPSFLIYGI
ncbi:hypothetical protein Hanom_Chr08g00746881 [Helianthus anomalus]